MDEFTKKNKIAWEYDAYNFWASEETPSERAKKTLENPRAMLKIHSKYFDNMEGVKIANICGSCGKRAIALAILGAEVTVFDISEANMKYAYETAKAAKTKIDYVVGDVMEIDMTIYSSYFDIVYMEGGILHYFHDINKFMAIMFMLLRDNGKMICSDFHPLHKIYDVNGLGTSTINPNVDYFSTDISESEMAHAKFYEKEKREGFPKCMTRRYTLSDIINSVIKSGFIVSSFEEHPGWTNKNLPGEFTLVAEKGSFINDEKTRETTRKNDL